MQILDSLIDGALELSDEREANELIGMMVRFIRTGKKPDPKSDVQKMALTMVFPVLEKSRNRVVSGSKGGSKTTSKTVSKQVSKTQSKCVSKQGSDIYSSSYIPIEDKDREYEGKEKEHYDEIVSYLNAKTGTSYRSNSSATQRLIHARINEGFTVDDFKQVIDTMTDEWGNDSKMRAYLRPGTLFGTKFESYLNRIPKHSEVIESDFSEYA